MRFLGVTTIVNHDHKPGERPPVPPVKKFIKRCLHFGRLLSCTKYIGVSRFVYRRFIENGCVPAKKCSYVHNGIIPVASGGANSRYAHSAFNLPEDAILIVTTGRATFYKGIDFLVTAFGRILESNPDKTIFFIHCGDGPGSRQIKGFGQRIRRRRQLHFRRAPQRYLPNPALLPHRGAGLHRRGVLSVHPGIHECRSRCHCSGQLRQWRSHRAFAQRAAVQDKGSVPICKGRQQRIGRHRLDAETRKGGGKDSRR